MSEAFPMNGGDSAYSYSKNSDYQREATNAAKEMISEVIGKKLDVKSLTSVTNTIHIADLGCSVGPNTFIAIQNVIEAVEKKYLLQGPVLEKLEFQVFFNDHTSNDFNTLFTSLPPDRQYFATGVPGSFYGRLFPCSSLQFFHSSYALHWLSKVPEEVLDKTTPAWNKGKIYYTSSSNCVVNAYAAQFAKDMQIFLNVRAKELVTGGMMVLCLPGRPDEVHHSKLSNGVLVDFLGSSLMDMVNAGIISEDQVDTFNLPIYNPSVKEMTEVVERNGSFSIENIEFVDTRPKTVLPLNAQVWITHLRAILEGILSQHFGREIIGEMFDLAYQKSADLSRNLENSYDKKTQLFVVLKRE